jgi:hypothetical protein
MNKQHDGSVFCDAVLLLRCATFPRLVHETLTNTLQSRSNECFITQNIVSSKWPYLYGKIKYF